MVRRSTWSICVGAMLCGRASAQGPAKSLRFASPKPAFYATVGTHLERGEHGDCSCPERGVAVDPRDVTMLEVLTVIEGLTRLRFTYNPSISPINAVSLYRRGITVNAALTQDLRDASVNVAIVLYGIASLCARNGSEDSLNAG